METPDKIYIPNTLLANTVAFKNEDSIEYIRTDYAEKVFLRIVDNFLSEFHRVCDITDWNGDRLEVKDLQAMFEDFYKAKRIDVTNISEDFDDDFKKYMKG